MKSMKEIADELNVTKMTVYNNAKKANVKFQKIDNVNYLTSEDEIIVINRIRKNQNKNDDFESEKKEETNNDNLVKDETIKQLYNQIDIYKEQSNRDKEQINTLNRLLENQQVLALESNKKIQKLENQLEEERQLNYSFDTSTNERQSVDEQETTYTMDSVNMNQYQEKAKEAKIQYSDIPESKNDESIQGEEAQKEDDLSKQNDNDSNIEYKSEEKQPKKGFWGRLFGS
ncbi:DUF536 domain-containing protein [Staphylococcus xylosus]|uniref:DUF536 domain-containing protein n=2 Tax=Staphylococcus TaxID=1279 RepID=UPI002DB6C3C9|nr:DUF536 domain-containing protein [Staphylococcus xylosus]MEB7385823.1 DUF536 domain-containing protein [Staphylococcus xylosus]MEB7833133.1 DUF536 domain-containing protein [Staphylococcus xylosus]